MTPSSPNTTAKRPRRLGTAERQQEIVAAVLEFAREFGPEAITTQAIADRIGLTHGALFRHFPDKEAMWTAVFDWVQVQLGALIESALRAGGTPLEILRRVFLAHVDFVAHHPGVPRILFHELQRPVASTFHERVRAMVTGYRHRLCGVLADAKKSGQLPDALDEEAAAVLFIGTVQGLVVQSTLLGGEGGMRNAAERLYPLLLDGFRGAKG